MTRRTIHYRHRRQPGHLCRPAFGNIGRGFGLRGHEMRDLSIVPKLFANFSAQRDIQISDKMTAAAIRKTIKHGHGKL
jgi:acetolactate synthase I/II/III large subunit